MLVKKQIKFSHVVNISKVFFSTKSICKKKDLCSFEKEKKEANQQQKYKCSFVAPFFHFRVFKRDDNFFCLKRFEINFGSEKKLSDILCQKLNFRMNHMTSQMFTFYSPEHVLWK